MYHRSVKQICEIRIIFRLIWILIYIFGIYQVLPGSYPESGERNQVVNLLYPNLRDFNPLNGTRN